MLLKSIIQTRVVRATPPSCPVRFIYRSMSGSPKFICSNLQVFRIERKPLQERADMGAKLSPLE